jgi:UDP-2,4-diacetamido-2,4,6-trideoxy-beta-L-altropyranose hydrolase
VQVLPAAAGWQEDAVRVGALLADEPADWIVVDHYGLDARWEGQLRAHARVMAIDDLANRPHACDLLLDQNLYDDQATRYDGLVQPGCERLLGPAYALLRPQFAAARAQRRAHAGQVQRVLVCFGGSDPGNETAKALDALAMLDSGMAADVVVGAGNPHWRSIEQRCSQLPWATFHMQVEDMAALMLEADLCVGAGGSMSWERCCVGLPGILLAVADNQVQAMRTLARHGCVRFLGMAEQVSAGQLAQAVSELMRNPGQLVALAERGLQLVDGEGTARVAARLAAMQEESER